VKLWASRCGDLYTDLGGLLDERPNGVIGDVPVMCFAVDTGDGVVVFETALHESCCGPDPASHFGSMLSVFELRCPRHALVDERLRQAGYSVDEVRWVVNSHLHFDHAGRNTAFPVATQYVRTRELEWAWAWERSRKPSGVLPGDLAELSAHAWGYDDTFDFTDGVTPISTRTCSPRAISIKWRDVADVELVHEERGGCGSAMRSAGA
jgi:glyoxylase-like metal-dependent hydrolase (beta-lactamase superfamily II)